MFENALDRVGELLMSRVRDKAIGDWDRILDGRMKGSTADRVRAELAAYGPDCVSTVQQMIPKIVDTTLHYLLWMLEQERDLNLSVQVEGKWVTNLPDLSDGLSGELYGKRGWIARFSKERHEEG